MNPATSGSTPETLRGLLADVIDRYPERPAIRDFERPALTFRELGHLVDRAAGQLAAAGVGVEDRIAIALPNGPEMATSFLVASMAGACAPLNPGYRQSEFEFYLSDLKARALITLAGSDSSARAAAASQGVQVIDLSPDLDGHAGAFRLSLPGSPEPLPGPTRRRPDHTALALHTSGTTSRPKIVPLSQRNLCVSASNISGTLRLGPTDCCLNVMPLFHIHGLCAALLASLSSGASIACSPGFDSERFFQWLHRARPTWYTAVPTMHQAILDQAAAHPDSVSSTTLRFIRSSSSALAPSVLRALEETFGVPVVEAYGMTEASHQMASNPLPPARRIPGTVGVAAGPEIAIMDAAGALLPSGQIGEIVIRGENVTRGYESNPDANRSAFTGGWFRTGDEGVLDESGYLTVTGRIKELINQGGEKISPREVDEVLLDFPGVAQAVAFAVPHPKLGEVVAAAVVLEDGAAATEQELRDFALGRLADFKVPTRIVFVERIPKGPTGKLQRIGLHEKLGHLLETASGEASGEVQRSLREMWRSLLGVDEAGSESHFFLLGGDSLTAARLLARVRATFALDLPPSDVFRFPVLKDLAAHIEHRIADDVAAGRIVDVDVDADTDATHASTAAMGHFERPSRDGEAGSMPRRPVGAPLVLTPMQEQLWFLEELYPGSALFNRPCFVKMRGELHLENLEQALAHVLARHEILSMRVDDEGGLATPRLVDAPRFTLSLVDLTSLSMDRRREEALRIAREEAREPFDLRKGPLIRARCVRLSAEEHWLLCTFHHIVFDGWSEQVLLDDLAERYRALQDGRSAELASDPVQYGDYAHAYDLWLASDRAREELAYWKEALEGSVGHLDLPATGSRSESSTFSGSTFTCELPKELLDRLERLSLEEDATLFMTLLGALKVVLSRYCSARDVTVGTPIAGRHWSETERLIGCFINTLPLRTDLSGNPSFRDLLARVRRIALDAMDHKTIGYSSIVDELQPDRRVGQTPLFNVLFQLRNQPGGSTGVPGLTMEPFQVDRGIAAFDLSIEVSDALTDSPRLRINFSTDLFDLGTIERLASNYQEVLRGAVAEPDRAIGELPLVATAERRQVLREFNDTARELPRDATIPAWFERQAALTPDAVALVDGDRQLKYGELSLRVDEVAGALAERRLGRGDRVGVWGPPSLEMVVGLLGVLKAGGCYVPLPIDAPSSRIETLLEDARIECVITSGSPRWPLDAPRPGVLDLRETLLDGAGSLPSGSPGASARREPDGPAAEDLAYTIYTSGTTGVPNGVCVTHRAVVNLMAHRTGEQFRPRDFRVAALTAPLHFDASVVQIFSPLLTGGTLVVGRSLDEVAESSWYGRLTVLTGASSLLGALVHRYGLPPAARVVGLGVEPIPADLWDTLLSSDHVERVSTGYGLTECTCYSTYGVVHEKRAGTDSSRAVPTRSPRTNPIGRPIANTRVYVLDRYLEPVPVGVPGELYVGGAGVARGYWNRPELTAERFVASPFEPDDTLFRSGDLARWLPDGTLQFLGRRDEQIKLRGYRIEPGEIESALSRHPAVLTCAVLARDTGAIEKRLTAFWVAADDRIVDSSELRAHLAAELPDYMVPADFVRLDALPMTSNGKVNRRALGDIEIPEAEVEIDYDPPRTSVERTVAEIWREVLAVERIGRCDDFFRVGGNSLAGVRIIAQIESLLGVSLSLRTMFDASTLREFALAVEAALPAGSAA